MNYSNQIVPAGTDSSKKKCKPLYGYVKYEEKVLAISLTEYDEEAVMRSMREEGCEEGIQEKNIEAAAAFLKENISPEVLAKCAKIPPEQILELQKQIY